jgi:hypothetical protein
MNTSEQKNYLISKYVEDGLLDNDEWFNPYNDPRNEYIPICSQCNIDFENFKKSNIQDDMEVEMKHTKACLWGDYFIRKIRNICKSSKIVRKIKRK